VFHAQRFARASLYILVLLSSSACNEKDISSPLKVSGTIEVTSTEVSFKVPGRIRERLVDEGEAIRKGQLVARLEDADLVNEVAVRKAQVEISRQALAELEAGSRRDEVRQAEAAVARVEAEAKRLSDDLRRQQELFSKEVISRQRFESVQASHDAVQAQLREARAALALVREGPRRERIAQGRARLREAEAGLKEAETRLGYATLTAPMAGMVTAKHAEPGEQVNPGSPVVTVGDLASCWLRAYIPETKLGRVKLGQRVRVTSDTYKGKAYEGTITFISPEAEFTPKNVQTEKERVKLVYRIKVTIPNPQQELKPGMPADGEIIIGTGDSGLGTGK
jgi:HlyD family secretion protein